MLHDTLEGHSAGTASQTADCNPVSILVNLGGTLEFNIVRKAMTHLQQLIQLVPGLTQSHVKFASVYMEQGEFTWTFKLSSSTTRKIHHGQGEVFKPFYVPS